jgi:mRNA-degrading endonuclease toxin of MazEF toxin-antitoxin module
VAGRYVPDVGHIVWLRFTPQAGHEQAGHRPALVLSPATYNAKTGFMVLSDDYTNAELAAVRTRIIALIGG